MRILTEIVIEERDKFEKFQGKNQGAKMTPGGYGQNFRGILDGFNEDEGAP